MLRGCVHNRLAAAEEKEAPKEITNRRPRRGITEAVPVPLHIVGDPFPEMTFDPLRNLALVPIFFVSGTRETFSPGW